MKERTFFFLQKRPTWQRSCISDLPSACQPSSRGNIAKKTQKQAVSYRRRSHGNRPAEGAPVPTLICTDSPLPDSTAEWWWWWGALSRGGLLISVSDLSCEVPRGGGKKKKEGRDSWDYDDDADGPAVPTASSPG